jgi:hypothetical protein
MVVLPKVHPAFGYPDSTESAVFNGADQAIRNALRTLEKPSRVAQTAFILVSTFLDLRPVSDASD